MFGSHGSSQRFFFTLGPRNRWGLQAIAWAALVPASLLSGLLPRAAFGQEILTPVEGVSPSYAELVRGGAINQVNHLSSRRRLTTFFVNEQSPFYGVQVNYVNVGRGNLTFLNRDLVRLSQIPIVIGRVYDSRSAMEGDFGPGWKLSVAEAIRREGSELRYVDAGGSEYLLKIEGERIVSPYPHLTGIERGRRVNSMIELDTGELIKRFSRIGDALYLDEVRTREGDRLQFEYDGTRIVRVTSGNGRFVTLRRDLEGRISQIEDDAGRAVSYRYDEAGRLAIVVDIGGRSWQHGYDENGLLTSVVDPRGNDALEAVHGEGGRVRNIRVLYDAMSFEYDSAFSSTAVHNAHQQAAAFWQDPSGLTTVAQDFAGAITELRLSDDLHPIALSFDGSLVARLEYSDSGKLRTVTNVFESTPSLTRLEYNEEGRVTSVFRDGDVVARYEYDGRGRPLYASDSSGDRTYEYDGRSLRRLTVGSSALDLRTSALGLLTGFRSEAQAVRLVYDERDQLRRIAYTTDDQALEASFEYDSSGLRTDATYVAGSGEIASLVFGYDEVGNLNELLNASEEEQQGGQTYILGDNNQLVAVRNNANARPDLTFDYDFSGRPIAARLGNQIIEYDYDSVGRLSAVYREGAQVLQSDYGPMDVDVATEADGHAAHISVSAPVASAIFGSLEAIAYDRTRGTPYGPIRFNSTMARFVLDDQPVQAPDNILLASFQRRALPVFGDMHHGYGGDESGVEVASPSPMGFDKPSNGLFLPAEFSSLNCYYCIAYVAGSTSNIYLKVNGTSSGTPTLTTGQWGHFESAVSSGLSPQCLVDISGGGSGYGYFNYAFDATDNWYATDYKYGTNVAGGYKQHAFGYPGLYGVNLYIACSCQMFFETFVSQEQRNVEVIAPGCPNPPYPFHQANPRLGAPITVIKIGGPSDGTITIQGTISATPESFDLFKQGVESYWNKVVVAAGVNLTIDVQLTRDLLLGAVDLSMPIEPLPSGTTPTPENCGQFDYAEREMIVRRALGCTVSSVSAHEMGHWLKFADAYDKEDEVLPIAIFHCDPEDIMALGDEVKWYHGLLLWERL